MMTLGLVHVRARVGFTRPLGGRPQRATAAIRAIPSVVRARRVFRAGAGESLRQHVHTSGASMYVLAALVCT